MMKSLAISFLPLLALAGPVKRQTPPAAEITILSTSFSGNGCPADSVTTDMSTDGTVVTFGFDSFQTYIGPGVSIEENSKNCQLHLTLAYPGGFQYSVVDATYHGYAQLDAGVTGAFFSTYYFSEDASDTVTTETTVPGGGALAAGAVYTKDDEIPTTSIIWSPCGAEGILNVNNRIALTANSTTVSGQLSDDDATVAFTQQLHVSWQSCTAATGSSGDSWTIGSG